MPGRTQANNKTQPNDANVYDYLASLKNKGRAEDAETLLRMMIEITAEKPRMWGPTIIGFGEYHYAYESGREGHAMLVGFAPRKANMVIYIMPGFSDYQNLLAKLGKHRTGSSCLYLGRLTGTDLNVLRQLIERSVEDMRKQGN